MKIYNTQRICGVWLAYIGFIIMLAAIIGGDQMIQPFVLGFGGALGYVLIYMFPYLNKKLSYGTNSKFQDRMDNLNIIVTIVLCTACGMFIGFENVRLVWLCILIVVGIHFFGFYFSQGKWMIVLGIITILNCVVGLIFSNIPFLFIAIIDGLAKMIIGGILMSLKRK